MSWEQGMTDRWYRLIFGGTLLASLYFEWHGLVLALIGLLAAEGISNVRLSQVAVCIGKQQSVACPGTARPSARLNFEAERALRLLVAVLLLISYVLYREPAWFLSWLVGFALVGAGISGICPMVPALKCAGFK